MTDREEDTDHLYRLLGQIEGRRGGTRTLAESTARSGWPSHGLYFFFEAGEQRRDGNPRIVRIGTHALTTTSRATLWNRLAQHRGRLSGSNPGGGDHRGSIFRSHVGAALLRRNGAPDALVASWLAKHPDPLFIEAEREQERVVSAYIGSMPFVWMAVPTRLDRSSDRGYLERNCIALLSTAAGGVEPASDGWLGHHAINPAISRSGLWNVNHVDESHECGFLQVLAGHVES